MKGSFSKRYEELQRNVIRHLVENPADRGLLPAFNPSANETLIEKNRKVVQERYSLKAYGDRLLGIYRRLAATEPGTVSASNADKLLGKFLQPRRFNLLRT